MTPEQALMLAELHSMADANRLAIERVESKVDELISDLRTVANASLDHMAILDLRDRVAILELHRVPTTPCPPPGNGE
jgi:hypothetical protein